MQTLPWIVALAAMALALAGLAAALVLQRRRPRKPRPLPTEWALSARPVFNTDERRVYRLLREALPHHVLLCKLPLVRFCQPVDPDEVHYWYDLLGGIHVSFSICSANGRVLAAIDLDNDRGNSRRVMQIKQSVLAACRIRYLRCDADSLPSVAELQLLVPHSSAVVRGPQPAPIPTRPLDPLRPASAAKRPERMALWQDSSFFHDSFFAPDSRLDEPVPPAPGRRASGDTSAFGHSLPPLDDIGGIVVDTPRAEAPPTRH